jgi:5-methylcytosine-specific restriction endonuclease McrA
VLVCESPLTKGPRKGQPATGSMAGVRRHYRADEPLCDDCVRANRSVVREWEKSNPERRRVQARETARRARRVNPERVRAIEKAWRERHPEASSQKTKRWMASHPEAARELVRRRRVRLAGAPAIPFTVEQLEARLSMFPGCWLCGDEADTVDHVIPLARGGWHCLSNLRPACGSCNSSKGARDWRDVA